VLVYQYLAKAILESDSSNFWHTRSCDYRTPNSHAL